MATKKAKSTKSKTIKVAAKASKKADTNLNLSSASFSQLKNPFGKNGKLRNLNFDKRVVTILVVIIILLALGFVANKYFVVAWVDNKPISRIEYYNELSKRYGKDELEQLIVQKLIESEAQKKAITVSDEEVQAQIAQIEASQPGGASQLDQILQMQNLTREDLKGLVKLQIMRQKLFGAGFTITDAEIKQYMDENKASMPEIKQGDASGEAQLKENVRQQLLQDRVSATFSAWLQENKDSNRVVRVQP